LAIGVLAFEAGAFSLNAESWKAPEQTPHAAALDLVFREGLATIREANKDDWWHDTKSHDWQVQRPFAPGFLDSTHMFTVTYKIDGKSMAAWSVDTKKNKVELLKPGKK
jgi:hypothetical protein